MNERMTTLAARLVAHIAQGAAREREALEKVHDLDVAFARGMLAEIKIRLAELNGENDER